MSDRVRPLAGLIVVALLTPASHLVGFAQPTTAPSRTRSHVETLASERLEGRLAGTNGERLAAEYLVSQLQRIGARPLPGAADFRLPFEFTAGTKDGGSSLGLTCADKETSRSSTRCQTAFGAGAISTLSFSDDGE